MSGRRWTLGGDGGSSPPIWDRGRVLDPSSVMLTKRVAVVTGGARGIGAATAVALARFGADLAICDREADDMAGTAATVRELGRECLTGLFDVRDPEARDAWLAEVAQAYGRVDVLVNNAGGTFNALFPDISPKGEAALIAENFTQVTGFIRGCVPLMSEGGSIINVTSIEAHRAGPGFSIYSAMKAAQANLAKTLSLELAPAGIRVNCIAPDVIPTEAEGLLGADAIDKVPDLASQPWPETGSVHDCAAAVVYLAGDMSRFVTGSTIHIDGGNLAAAGWKRRTPT